MFPRAITIQKTYQNTIANPTRDESQRFCVSALFSISASIPPPQLHLYSWIFTAFQKGTAECCTLIARFQGIFRNSGHTLHLRYLQDDWDKELGGAFRAHAVRPKTAARQNLLSCNCNYQISAQFSTTISANSIQQQVRVR